MRVLASVDPMYGGSAEVVIFVRGTVGGGFHSHSFQCRSLYPFSYPEPPTDEKKTSGASSATSTLKVVVEDLGTANISMNGVKSQTSRRFDDLVLEWRRRCTARLVWAGAA